MNPKTISKLFLIAALFNWVVGIALMTNAPLLLGLFNVTPVPTEPVFVSLSGWLIICYGIGYFWASRDFAGNLGIIWLGIIGKLGVFGVVLMSTLLGQISWQMNIVSSVDLVFAVLFILAIRNHDGP
jgi:hypothetical protein